MNKYVDDQAEGGDDLEEDRDGEADVLVLPSERDILKNRRQRQLELNERLQRLVGQPTKPDSVTAEDDDVQNSDTNHTFVNPLPINDPELSEAASSILDAIEMLGKWDGEHVYRAGDECESMHGIQHQ